MQMDSSLFARSMARRAWADGRVDQATRLPVGDLGIGVSAQALRAGRRPAPYCSDGVHLCPLKSGVEPLASTWHDRGAAQSAGSLDAGTALMTLGGLLSADDVAWRMRPHYDQPISQLARWIVTRAIVVVPARSCTLVPLFQFDQSRMTLKAEVSAALAELVPVFDDLEVATWFVEPNRWLGGLAPVESLGQGIVAILQAARADRFIACG